VIPRYGLSNSSNCNDLECPWRSFTYCKPFQVWYFIFVVHCVVLCICKTSCLVLYSHWNFNALHRMSMVKRQFHTKMQLHCYNEKIARNKRQSHYVLNIDSPQLHIYPTHRYHFCVPWAIQPPTSCITYRARQYAHKVFCAILAYGLLLGYLGTSGAKYDVMFLLVDRDFLHRWRNFMPISINFEIWRKTDRWQTRRRKEKALTLCEPNNIDVKSIILPYMHCASSELSVGPFHRPKPNPTYG